VGTYRGHCACAGNRRSELQKVSLQPQTTFVISGTILRDLASLIKKRKKATGLKEGKNEKVLTIHNYIVGTDSVPIVGADSLHRVPGQET
jgi:hypothetical protein